MPLSRALDSLRVLGLANVAGKKPILGQRHRNIVRPSCDGVAVRVQRTALGGCSLCPVLPGDYANNVFLRSLPRYRRFTRLDNLVVVSSSASSVQFCFGSGFGGRFDFVFHRGIT
jgi:hypothetical protein